MKTERINIRIDKETKEYLEKKAGEYGDSLSKYLIDTVLITSETDYIQLWVEAYCRCVIKRNRPDISQKITCYGSFYMCGPLKSQYHSKCELLEAINDFATEQDLPYIYSVAEHWEEFTRRLELLGLYEQFENGHGPTHYEPYYGWLQIDEVK